MYSLYRSWLSQGGVYPVHVPDPGPVPLPDVVVAVGQGQGHQFTAHRAVLSANSGYFKATLGTLGALGALGQDASPACVAVHGVTAEAFAPLLGYMYTGYLDIGSDNIYDVLLATHYLHMPRALELCRNFLRAHPPAGTLDGGLDGGGGGARSTLVKPIAGLPWRPALIGPAPGPPQPPAPHVVLPTAEHSPFRAPFLAAAGLPATAPPRSANTPAAQPKRRHDEDADQQPGQPAAKRVSRVPSREAAAASPPAAVAAAATPTTAEGRRPSPAPTTTSAPDPIRSAPAITTTATTTSTSSTSPSSSSSTASFASKVVYDVACCDGPVRFHRVLNESYGREDDLHPHDDHGGAEAEQQQQQPADENQLHVPGANQLRRARIAASNGVAVGGEYRCQYCNHTFKSHYCYQKHARRHLNPLTPKLEQAEGQAVAVAASSSSGTAAMAAPRAPARPLDMNVQYYPCKTCGSKFPSYYFVHKHRKMCHSAEDGEAAAAGKAEAE